MYTDARNKLIKKQRENNMTIQEIARLAKVSVSTVSKVMNGKDKDISEPTKQRVLKVIEENNYIPYEKYRVKEGIVNRLAGLVLQKKNIYCAKIIAETESILQEQGFHLLVRMVEDPEELDQAVEELLKRGVAGILIDSPRAVGCVQGDCKVVYFADTMTFDYKQENTFYYRKSEAGKQAVRRLLKAGHERIGCILGNKDESIRQGIESICREEKISGENIIYYFSDSLEDIQENAMVLCANAQVSAVICGSAENVHIVLTYAKEAGIKCPEELSLICMGDYEPLPYMGDGITAVKYPVEATVRDAAKHLIKMISESKDCELTRKFESEIIERGSIAVRKNTNVRKIVVVGSLNTDNIIDGDRIPVSGETLIARDILTTVGGKGRNQAAGVGRLGGNVYLIGRIGKDMDGHLLYKSLKESGIHLDGIEFDEEESSGKAYIHIDKEGESAIVVYRGANGRLDGAQMQRHQDIFEHAKYCLLSTEISWEALLETIKICRKNGTEIILKPSGLEKVTAEILEGIDYLVPNEREMAQILTEEKQMERKCEKLLAMGVKNVIVTLGKEGSYLRNEKYSMYFPSAPFTAVDTTGGADSFISAMAVMLNEGKDLIYSIIYATYAAGITITRYGVQESLPDKKTVQIYLEEIEKQYQNKMKEE